MVMVDMVVTLVERFTTKAMAGEPTIRQRLRLLWRRRWKRWWRWRTSWWWTSWGLSLFLRSFFPICSFSFFFFLNFLHLLFLLLRFMCILFCFDPLFGNTGSLDLSMFMSFFPSLSISLLSSLKSKSDTFCSPFIHGCMHLENAR